MKNPILYLLSFLFPLSANTQNIYGFVDKYFVSFNPYTEETDTLMEFEGPPYISLGFRTAIDRYNGRYFFGGEIPGLPGKFHIIDLDSLTITNYPVYPQKIEYDFLHNKLVYEYSGSFYSLDLVTMTIKKLSDIENASGGQVFGQVRTYVPQYNQYVYIDFPDLSPSGAYYITIDATTGEKVCEEYTESGGDQDAHGLVTNNQTGEIIGHIEQTVGFVDPCIPLFQGETDIEGYSSHLNTQLCVYDHINQKYIVPFAVNEPELQNLYAIIDPYSNQVLEIKNHPFNKGMNQHQIYDKPCPPLINLHDTLFVPIGKKYKWFLNGQLLDVTTGLQNYWIPNVPGTYTAEVEFKTYACTSNSIEVTTVGIDDVSSEDLIIYPNPTLDEFCINNVKAPFKYVLLDMTGNVIRESVSDHNVIPVEELKSGTYFIQVILNDTRMTGRIVKI
ncbi:MAG TPA: T9SS type A sorting domain-containing protein [Saprospiraceae bacterium]|nr:T9SS type A sorting domain-containing protein [Saprospiraceae bacterium]